MTKPRTFTRRYWTDADRLTQAYILLNAAGAILENVAIAHDRAWDDTIDDIIAQSHIVHQLAIEMHDLEPAHPDEEELI